MSTVTRRTAGRQVTSLLAAMDLDEDGFVDQNEFIQSVAPSLPTP